MSSLEDLKSLLLGQERADLQRLRQRVEDPAARAQDVSHVLSHSLRLRGEDPTLVDALAQPVDRCIERSVKRNPQVLAEALFPVMGPAIRRYIADALKGMVQSINQTLDHSLSLRGLGWRLQAVRSGVPFAEIVLRNTLAYRVDQVFLIKPDTGLLIEHVADPDVAERDSDAVSAMLTAIQAFVKDAFAAEEPIDTLDMGEQTVWLHHGPHAYLACVIRGLPPRRLRARFDEALEAMHREFGVELRGFNGDRRPLQPLVPLLEDCLIAEHKAGERRRVSPALVVVLAAMIGLLGWWGYRLWQDHQAGRGLAAQQARLAQLLRVEPGYVLTELRRRDGAFVVHGLRDPLARPLSRVLADAGLSSLELEPHLADYQAGAPTIALARAEQRLQPPVGVELRLTPPGRLSAVGVAPREWITQAELLAKTVPGVEAFDGSGLEVADQRLLREIRRRLAPPATVELELAEGRLRLTGEAPAAWIASVEPALADLDGLSAIETGALRAVERRQLEATIERIEAARVYFGDGVQLRDAAADHLRGLGTELQRLFELSEVLQLRPLVRVIGQTDGSGDPGSNAELGLERARVVVRRLAGAVPQADLQARSRPTTRYQGPVDYAQRRVEFEVELQDGDR